MSGLLIPFYSLGWTWSVGGFGGEHATVRKANDFTAFGQWHGEERDAWDFEFVVVWLVGGNVPALGAAVGGWVEHWMN